MQRLADINFDNRDVVQPPEEIVGAAAGSGRWQLLVTLMLSLPIFTHIMNNAAEVMPHHGGYWCRKPSYLSRWKNRDWIMYSHINVRDFENPLKLIDLGLFKGCRIYDVDYESLKFLDIMNVPPITTNKTIPCPNKVDYSNKSGYSIAQKFDKGCDEIFEKSILWSSANAIGMIVGYVIFGFLGDNIGRRRVMFISCGITPITAIIVSLVSRYEYYIVIRIIHGFFHSGFAMCIVMISEISTNNCRSRLMAIGCTFHAIGIGMIPVVINVFESMSQMMLFINIPCVVFFVSAGFVPESPSWLFCMRENTQIENLIKKAAKMNGTTLPSNFRIIYIEYMDDRQRMPRKRPQFWNILFEPETACEVIGITYLTALLAISFGSAYTEIMAKLVKSHESYTLLGASATTGMLIGQLCTLLMGHRKILQISIGMLFTSSMLLLVTLSEAIPSITGPKMTLLMVNIGSVCLSYGVLLNYDARTIPTLLRSTFVGIWRATWILFSEAAIHNFVHFPGITSTLIITCLIAAVFSLNIRDLMNRELPDTLCDSIFFREKPKPKRWAISELHTTTKLKQEVHVNVEVPSKMTVQQSVSPNVSTIGNEN